MKYHVLYRVTPLPNGIEREDVARLAGEDGNVGACDAVILMSMLYPEDGSFSLAVVSMDGRTGEEVPDHELWKVWAMLAHRLAESETLTDGRREVCRQVHEAVRKALLASRGKGES